MHFEHLAWAGERTYRLFQETLIPVCHPSLLGDNEPKALLDNLPRLHRRQNPEAWQDYARETNITLTNPAIGARYDLHTMLIEAAISGLGVALVPRIYVKKELELGNLIAPWPESAIVSKTFCLVLPESIMLNELPVQKFAKWIISEAKIA
ncbi:LysR substrate-binding domain-containing protein [Marinomonas polaris]|uniref:LysR substrate-binding domain-containing protein n=1 Tax=Marinomonas polaris TaxID=293552 RepID=UPI000934A6C2|nr:LysR substrate-binding domain-containing protein [Marinomonas polaris]